MLWGTYFPLMAQRAWALPMAEGNARSSIIRRHVRSALSGPAEPKAGDNDGVLGACLGYEFRKTDASERTQLLRLTD